MKAKAVTIKRISPRQAPSWASNNVSTLMFLDKVNELKFNNYRGDEVSSKFIVRDIQGLGWLKLNNAFTSEVGKTRKKLINVSKVQRDITFILQPYGHRPADGIENLRDFFNSFFIDQPSPEPLIRLDFYIPPPGPFSLYGGASYYTDVYISEINTVYFSQEPMLSVTFQSNDDYFQSEEASYFKVLNPVPYRINDQRWVYPMSKFSVQAEIKEGRQGVYNNTHRLINLKNVRASTPFGVYFSTYIPRSYVNLWQRQKTNPEIGVRNYTNDTYFYARIDPFQINLNDNTSYGFVSFNHIPEARMTDGLAVNIPQRFGSFVLYSQGYNNSVAKDSIIPELQRPYGEYRVGVWDNFRCSERPLSLSPGSNLIGLKSPQNPRPFERTLDPTNQSRVIFNYGQTPSSIDSYEDDISFYFYDRIGAIL